MLRIVPILLLSLITAPALAEDVEFHVDKNHSHVGFTARHLTFAKVRGQFTEFDATVVADSITGKLSALDATVRSASVNTDNAKRDKHLRSDDFFAASKHPSIRLKLKSIIWRGDDLTATADLTIRESTRQVVFKGTLLGSRIVNFGRGRHLRAAYEVSTNINRKDFGLNFNGVAEGTAIVSDKIEITLEIEIARSQK